MHVAANLAMLSEPGTAQHKIIDPLGEWLLRETQTAWLATSCFSQESGVVDEAYLTRCRTHATKQS